MPILTWPNTLGVLSSAAATKFPRVRTGEWNKKVVSVFVHNSGDSGPGKIRVRYQGPGDPTLGPPFVTDFNVEPVGHDVSFAPSRTDSLIMTAIKVGESDPTEWESTDDGETWTEL